MRTFPAGSAASVSFYEALAPWYPLLTPLEDYPEEAEALQALLGSARTVLELGSGAGHLSHHLVGVDRVLTDLSEPMLDLSRAINPTCEHVLADMRTLRLGRVFDAVFVHDAVCYMHTRDDLAAMAATARAHLGPGGVFVALPDYVAETLAPGTDDGGVDGPDGDGLRYLEWVLPDPEPPGYSVHYALMIRDAHGRVEVYRDSHREAAHPTSVWIDVLREAGFEVEAGPDPFREVVFVARVPPNDGSDYSPSP